MLALLSSCSNGGGCTTIAPLPLQQALVLSASNRSSVSAPLPSSASAIAKKDDRLPQWGYQETADFVAISAEFEKDFTHTKRNKNLWESIASKMKEKGYSCSAEQCKWKWKNVVNRYKGKEKLLLESESGAKMKTKGRTLGRSFEDFSDENDESREDERVAKSKKRKIDRVRRRASAEKCRAKSMQEVLEDFCEQQQRLELQWRENMERREEERRIREQEFRNAMERLENVRMMREQHWRKRDDQRRAIQEARVEKKDALFSAILHRLAKEDL